MAKSFPISVSIILTGVPCFYSIFCSTNWEGKAAIMRLPNFAGEGEGMFLENSSWMRVGEYWEDWTLKMETHLSAKRGMCQNLL